MKTAEYIYSFSHKMLFTPEKKSITFFSGVKSILCEKLLKPREDDLRKGFRHSWVSYNDNCFEIYF